MLFVCERGRMNRFCGTAPSPVMSKEVAITWSCSLMGEAIVSHVGSASSSVMMTEWSGRYRAPSMKALSSSHVGR